jgi:hypothetical protein
MKRLATLFFFLFPFFACAQPQPAKLQTSVLVIGGGAGGTAAAVQSARLGVKTILVEPTNMLGGMLTAAGVSCTDGNDQLPSGMWEEFRQALYKHYGRKKLNTGWVSNTNFEPHVADSIFKAWARAEKNLRVIFGYRFIKVLKKGNTVTGVMVESNDQSKRLTITASVVIDGTELGDIFAAAGAGYDLGMDDPAISGEKEARQKNDIIQDLTWAAILKDFGKDADKTIAKPEGYDAKKYYCCCTDAPCDGKPWNGDKLKMLNYGKLPRSPGATQDKYMLNWPPFGNDIYLNAAEDKDDVRTKKYEQAKQHTLGFIYFMQTELGMKNIGLADDELDKGMALIPYNREGRRLKGIVRMNINHIKDPYNHTLYRTGIAVGDYPVDHHHARYPGKVPEIEFPPIPAYNIPLGALIPENIDGLIVCEKGISVTNIVNGTTRLQPVVLLTGQAAGVLGAEAAKKHNKKPIGVKGVGVRMVQLKLLQAKAYLLPFTDVKADHPYWEQLQKIGATGILRGTGKPEGWANKMFFYPDSIIAVAELEKNITDYIPSYQESNLADSMLTIGNAVQILQKMHQAISFSYSRYPAVVDEVFRSGNFASIWSNIGLKDYQPGRLIKRFEFAALVDSLLDPFMIRGRFINIEGK